MSSQRRDLAGWQGDYFKGERTWLHQPHERRRSLQKQIWCSVSIGTLPRKTAGAAPKWTLKAEDIRVTQSRFFKPQSVQMQCCYASECELDLISANIIFHVTISGHFNRHWSIFLFANEWAPARKKKESPSKTELGRLLSQWPAEKKMSVLLITHRLSRLHQWTPWVSFEAMLSCNQGSTVSLSWPVLCGFHQEPKTEPTRNPMCWEIWWKT